MFLFSFALFWGAVVCVLKYVYSYWDRQGLPSVKPHIPFGNLGSVARKKESFGVAINELYRQTTGALVGIYLFYRPAILIRDPHLAQRIMTTDFGHFHDRGVYCNEKGDPFSANLFALPGKRWKNLRNKLTPTFTPGQMRNMLPTFLELSQKLQDHLEPMANRREVVEMRDVSSRFVLQIIASVFFGIDANCIEDPDDSFRRVIRTAQRQSFITNFRNAAVFVCPELLKITKTTSLHPEVIKFVTHIITEQIEYREKHGVIKKDFIQQLIDLRKEACENNELAMSLGQCASNVFLFYVAGSEPSTASIIFTLHELSQNPDIMRRLQTEIDETLEKSQGTIDYNILGEMKLLDLCMKETLRKYPGLPILNRECTEEYRVPDSGEVIKKGTQLIIPLLGISMDEKYFPEPERYLPERFDDASKRYDEKAYFPFGDGPRYCIGYRWGIVVAKIGLILLLSKYNFEPVIGPKIEFSPALVTLVPEGGIPLRITKREQ
ncbi:probable cytochrome P450 6d4 [Sabethes cyaneus]|uniref:probable cytochrome P450 6d4 n=1 Tax=Sabethes cyaneus TaxID=53552 RepID=UPI00237EC718|nr:probable cytochrome P450 6d4 [Sabethes cyaneus]